MLKSSTFNFPLICIGNLAVGGTGKSPMAEYIVKLLYKNYKVAILSRGYKRKTKGYALANPQVTALEIGDEPMQFYDKFAEDITVAVGEERLVAIPQILQDRPDTDVILLDDAFQHRYVSAGLNILLTEYKNLYTRDFMLPAGDLRDVRASAKRADIIVVTKCPTHIDVTNKKSISLELQPLAHQKIFFATLKYTQPYHLFTKVEKNLEAATNVLLICGIANPKPVKDHIRDHFQTYDYLGFPDHHIFDSNDLKDILKHFMALKGQNSSIITTEKDAVRLKKFKEELEGLPIYVLPIQHQIMFNEGATFDQHILHFVSNFSKVN